MSENIQRSKGRDSAYRVDRGGTPADFGPFVGIVMNNIDDARSGRLQVFIEEFGGIKNDSESWRTVSYAPAFFGSTNPVSSSGGYGNFLGNKHSYGMWFTPPDIGGKVLCVFASGDPNQGFYIGCVPEPLGLNHMVPAIGSVTNPAAETESQQRLLSGAVRLPVTEINHRNQEVYDNPRFFAEPKPVHAVQAELLWQQGLVSDPIRGPISTSSQRETPSSAYGISSPGKPIYRDGVSSSEIKRQLESGELKPEQIEVVGRMGGHTFVMDDGDISGKNQLIRLRTSKGHQITMSDDGDCVYITHANGQAWIELGKEGTLDVYATNSVNVRTGGDINFHADRDINMYAAGNLNMTGNVNTHIESRGTMEVRSTEDMSVYTEKNLTVLADGTLALTSEQEASIKGTSQLDLNSDGIVYIQTNGSLPTPEIDPLKILKYPDVKFNADQGWTATVDKFESTVSRVTTHEPYSAHNQGVDITTSLMTEQETETPTPLPDVTVRVE